MNLAEYRSASANFIEQVNRLSVFGQLDGFVRVPFDLRTLKATNDAVANWVPEGAPVPAARLSSFDMMRLPLRKLGVMNVFSGELARFWSPSTEAAIKNGLASALAAGQDRAFIDPASAPTSDTPGSVTHGAWSMPSSGSSANAIVADLAALAQHLVAEGSDLRSAAWILNTRTALYLTSLREDGAAVFPGLTPIGGSLLGLRAVASSGVPISASPSSTIIALVDPRRVLLADDSLVAIEGTTDASVAADDAPVGGAQQLTPLWQGNLAAAKLLRWINFERIDDTGVAVLDGVPY
jgi:HK97 family phage major capsid protein